MRPRRVIFLGLMACAMLGVTALAQEGHPLKGSWIGDWGPNANTRTPVLLVMDWDGKNVTGTLNPGTDNIPIKTVTITLPPPPGGAGGGARGGAAGGGAGGGGGARGAGAGGGAALGGGAAPAGGGAGAPAAGGGGQRGAGGGGGAAAGGGGGQRGTGGGGGAAAPLPDWTVRIEATSKDNQPIVIDGKMEAMALYNRSLIGTWTQGSTKGNFTITRQ